MNTRSLVTMATKSSLTITQSFVCLCYCQAAYRSAGSDISPIFFIHHHVHVDRNGDADTQGVVMKTPVN